MPTSVGAGLVEPRGGQAVAEQQVVGRPVGALPPSRRPGAWTPAA